MNKIAQVTGYTVIIGAAALYVAAKVGLLDGLAD